MAGLGTARPAFDFELRAEKPAPMQHDGDPVQSILDGGNEAATMVLGEDRGRLIQNLDGDMRKRSQGRLCEGESYQNCPNCQKKKT